MNLPSHNAIRRLIIFVGVCSIFFVVSHWLLRLQAGEFHSALTSVVKSKREAVAQRPYLKRLAEVAAQDREVLIETERWARLIELASQRMQKTGVDSAAIESPFASTVSGGVDGHWAFQALDRVTVPPSDNRYARNSIDYFIEAKLQSHGKTLGPPADKQTLIRRLQLGITGLTPLDTELSDSPSVNGEALDRLVDKLLNSHRFGEHWAQYWLDLARYADSNGYEEDELRPNAYPYRDFVIWALNHNLPWDQFLRWQIAGDELAGENPLAVAATGFLTAAPFNTFMPQESERFDELDDVVSTIGSAMLGISIGCARCHDHPYDDVAIDEYYALVSVFRGTQRDIGYLDRDAGQAFRDVDAYEEEIRQLRLLSARDENIEELEFSDEEKAILRLPLDPNNKEQLRLLSMCNRCLFVDDSFIDDDTEPLEKDRERYDFLISQIDNAYASLPERPLQGLVINGSGVEMTPVLWGGSLNQPGDEVGPRFPESIGIAEDSQIHHHWQAWDFGADVARPRAAFANWITDLHAGAGPVTARVAVNRVWLHHFGKGIVDTPSNLGREGAAPSHQDLLDWLAYELVSHGWDIKHIHRLILCSATYRQASDGAQESDRALFHRWWRQRLTAEMFHDSLLYQSGALNDRLYGPGFQSPIPRAAILNRNADDPDATWPSVIIDRPEIWRRSVYAIKKRTNPLPFLHLFDFPGGIISCPQRRDTTVPTQSLALWNDSFIRTQSEQIAERAFADSRYQVEGAIQRLFLRLLGRRADEEEIIRVQQFLDQGNGIGDFVQVLLMSNELWYFN
ncbi:MAG: DUF1549 and DUF1553 domain-containing protein [Rubripirellula sp.]|nr:DUF1549 and DUF1553 domain-containing protein [Rubripirellula sp.]